MKTKTVCQSAFPTVSAFEGERYEVPVVVLAVVAAVQAATVEAVVVVALFLRPALTCSFTG